MTRTDRKRGYAFFAIAALAAGAWWWIASDKATSTADALRAEPAQTALKMKPICAFPVNPNVAAPLDCIPPHLANLPPDPGEAGKATIDGIDADKDGIRDDVQRWIVNEWGHSQLAVEGLRRWAEVTQLGVHYGDDLGKEATRKLWPEIDRKITCYANLETQEMLEGIAFKRLQLQVMNTPERRQRHADFDYMFAHGYYPAFAGTPDEACGFDVAALAAKEGKTTINSMLRAEANERGKLMQQQEAIEDVKKFETMQKVEETKK